MISKEEYRKKLETLKSMEMLARESYDEDAREFKDENIIKTLIKIRDDETRHMKLIDEMIEILKEKRE